MGLLTRLRNRRAGRGETAAWEEIERVTARHRARLAKLRELELRVDNIRRGAGP